ncbi:hypothetical protein [Rhodococcus pyridinivorans]|uniref:capsular polysaccharide export protein, LipB/KpsS family n=1 Tax=Rhodococcus pyridinivorans TaxID=103816 RepID=UPI003AAF8AA2
MSRVLFVALGEEEVQADRYLSQLLAADGHDCKVVTWLPRLAGDGVESLYKKSNSTRLSGTVDSLTHAAGFPDAAFIAYYDRDWYFASTRAKREHGQRILALASEVIENWKPDIIVSAVGGETTRVAFDAIAKSQGIRRAYFNAIPLEKRFVLLPDMSSPFVPFPGGEGYKPRSRSHSEPKNGSLPHFSNHLRKSRIDPLIRASEVTVKHRGIYPRGWYRSKSIATLRERVLRQIPTTVGQPLDSETNIVYPMHDERDFQVAVRERHAIPQAHLLRYVSTTLPVGYRLWIKPHPEHLTSHHNIVMPEIAKCPNISFLEPGMHFTDAIDFADVILTLASTMGFEALKRSKPVVCYGTPFYSGYGLTTDVKDPRGISQAIVEAERPCPERLDELLARMAAYSWPGKFTPIDLSPHNLFLLRNGLSDVITLAK